MRFESLVSKRTVVTILAAGILAFVVAPVSAEAQNFTFTVNLNSGQEVPPNDSNAFGVGFVTFNSETQEVCFSISYLDFLLTSPETAAHFHAPAPPGQNAGIRINLPPGSPKNGCAIPEPPLTEEEVNNLFAGLWYVNIHTASHPGGEIRGQVISESNPVWFPPTPSASSSKRR